MKRIVFILFLVLIGILLSEQTTAQCAMCRATVGSNLSEGRNTIGTGLNFGILYLLAIPYLIVGFGIFFYIRAARKNIRERSF